MDPTSPTPLSEPGRPGPSGPALATLAHEPHPKSPQHTPTSHQPHAGSVAKLNFDHVFAEPLKGSDWHGWYNLPTALASWSCDGNGKFVVTANKPYYPLMQVRPPFIPLTCLSHRLTYYLHLS